MIVRAFPLFYQGSILRADMMAELAGYAYLFGDILYDGYSDGILSGCRLTTTRDAIVVNPGVIRHAGKNFLIKDPIYVAYYPTNSTTVLKMNFLGENRSARFVTYDAEVVLDNAPAVREGQIELCRFKLQPGAQLRYKYVSFEDRSTEYDTLNTLHVPHSAKERSTLSPEITYDYARELSGTNPKNHWDIVFCLQAADRSRPVAADAIALYLRSRLGGSAEDFSTNQALYEGLNQILTSVKREQDIAPRSKERRKSKILVD